MTQGPGWRVDGAPPEVQGVVLEVLALHGQIDNQDPAAARRIQQGLNEEFDAWIERAEGGPMRVRDNDVGRLLISQDREGDIWATYISIADREDVPRHRVCDSYNPSDAEKAFADVVRCVKTVKLFDHYGEDPSSDFTR